MDEYFKYWIENIEPWCISRQIWWGHRIPVWYQIKIQKLLQKILTKQKNTKKK